MSTELNFLEYNALSRIMDARTRFGSGLFCGHSGGKDSTLILYLAAKAFPEITIVHNCKDSTHPATIEFLYELGKTRVVNFVPPNLMEEFIKRNHLNCQIDGTRVDEASRTDGRSTDLIVEGESVSRTEMTHFVPNGLYGLNMLYPIYDWTEEQVWSYLHANNIKVSEEYAV
jgi:3'-phosphoadenosine 5'-phosphosulfate sulfotransferase (PAPS reductase)/FAD synthetase